MRPLLSLILLVLVPMPAHAGPLNDTGITFCGSYPSGNTAAPCTPNPAGQDQQYGRDAAAQAGVLYKIGGGEAGFDYTKVCMSGELAGQGNCPADPPLGSGANDWACTRDNLTGLVWEVKTDDGGLRDKGNTYTNYDDSTQPQRWNGSAYVNPTQSEIDAASNSIGYVNAVNALTGANRLCGATDWRRPTKKELLSIVYFGYLDPAIDTNYFPNTVGLGYWSSSPDAVITNNAWYVNFFDGLAFSGYYEYRENGYCVRLVRSGL